MKRIFSEFEMLIRKRKHLLSLIILLTIMSLSLFVFAHGLKGAISGAFELSDSEKGKTPIYTFTYKTDNVTDIQSLRGRIALNSMFQESEAYDYFSFLATEGTVTALTEATRTSLDAAGDLVITAASADVSQNYKVPVLFVDEATVKYLAASNASAAMILGKMFEGDAVDYDDAFPACAGFNWDQEWPAEARAAGGATRAVTTSKLGSVQISVTDIIPAGTVIKLGSKEINLDSYLIIPLRKIDEASSSDLDSNQEKRIFWCNLYDMRNEGVILAQMTADAVQRTVNNEIKSKGLSSTFRITIKNADNDNKLLFYDNIEGIQQIILYIAEGGLLLSAVFLMLYSYFTFSKNKKYELIVLMNGTGKAELIFVHIIQLVLWFVISVAASFILYIPIRMVTEVATVPTEFFVTVPAVIMCICIVLQVVCICLWDAGKMIRRI
ncbi:MAG: hypothetical protein K5848_08280 [Lachnospiraceae bacterium]|nr:hypothetical protein [Lachnospiraceae bacterium]